jgi:hypothetical protein
LCDHTVAQAIIQFGAAVNSDGWAFGGPDCGDQFNCGGLHLRILANDSLPCMDRHSDWFVVTDSYKVFHEHMQILAQVLPILEPTL